MARRLHNRYYVKSARTAVRRFRALTDKAEATEKFPKVVSLLDKIAGKGLISKNKASNLKSKLAHHMSKLA